MGQDFSNNVIKVFIVVGGRDSDDERYLDSSEKFTAGDLTWTNLATLETGGSSLLYLSRLILCPGLAFLSAATLENQVFLTGNILQIVTLRRSLCW